MESVFEKIIRNPLIAAIRKEEDAVIAASSSVTTVFVLHADIFNINSLVDKLKEYGKSVFIHFDFLEGIGRDKRAIDYISDIIKPDGIITTRSTHIKYAKEKGLVTIQRFFLIDSQSYDTMINTVRTTQPDMIEVMPAIMPDIIKRACSMINKPVIAGGLIESKKQIFDVLNAGALGVSTGKKALWEL